MSPLSLFSSFIFPPPFVFPTCLLLEVGLKPF